MSAAGHLGELRRVLIVSLVAWGVATAVAAVFSQTLIRLLEYPLTTILAEHNRLISKAIITSPTELFTVPLKVALAGGLLLAMPVILWQAWTFVAPGLRPAERRFAIPLVSSALLLFAAGGVLAYFLMPLWLNLLTGLLGGNVIYFPDLNQYLSFLALLMVAFGCTFELPVAVVLLGLLGLVSPQWLRRHRRVVWAVIVVGAELVTPGADPVTPLFLAVPLLGLFELSILVLSRSVRRHGTLTPAGTRG
ncbi:MAG TPA: twin-arginine translocase subunit TatC [Candidatus Binatia bacterium]|nr:twin-arginine translocase subunit TatC [Candidatus Binatia bacterium]